MGLIKKRSIALAAGILIEVCSGITYAWSVFQEPLMEKFACTAQQVTLIYTVNFWVSAVGFVILGPLLKKRMTIQREVFIGSAIYAGSILATSFVNSSFFMVFLLLGVFRSLGISIVYPVLMSYAVELFPERSGFACGMMSAGFGLGAMIWAPLAMHIHIITGDISNVFLAFGIIFAVVMLPLTFFLIEPDTNSAPKYGLQNASPDISKNISSLYNVNRREMLKLPIFYVALICLVFALSCGNLIVNQASSIVRNLFGLSISNAAFIVSVSSVFNVLGRFVCGPVSDKLGKIRVALLLIIITAAMMVFLVVSRMHLPFVIFMMMIVFCYGGLSGLVPPLTKELFGSTYFTGNYSVIYFVYAIGSLLGPMVGTTLLQRTSSYAVEFAYGAGLAALGSVMMLVIYRYSNKLRAK